MSNNPFIRSISRLLLLAAVILAFTLSGSLQAQADSTEYDVIRKEIKQGKKKTYDISVQYLQLTSPSLTTGQKAFNTSMHEYAGKKVAEFLHGVKTEKPAQNVERRIVWNLTYTSSVKYQTNDFISVLWEGSDFRGGANPTPESRALVYNLEKGRIIKLRELFKADSDYLKTLSDICTADLSKRENAQEDFIREGASAKPENYDNFYITEKGLVIHFPTYQVAPRSEGPQEVLIPGEKLREIINPNGPLGKTVKK